MAQFFGTYCGLPKLATLLRELSWSHNLAIMARAKRVEEREFYLNMAVQERWSYRQLERQLAGALFERVVLSPAKLSPPVRELHPDAAAIFKDSYLVEFLDLPKGHSEADLDDSLVEHLKDFLIEPSVAPRRRRSSPNTKRAFPTRSCSRPSCMSSTSRPRNRWRRLASK